MLDIHQMDVNRKTSAVNINKLCRLCAAQDVNPIPIFEGPGLELELEPKLQKYLSLKVSQSDVLPHHICRRCSNTLILWHELVVGCKEAEEHLLSLLSQNRIERNIVDDVILLDEDSQDSIKIIETDSQPSSEANTDSSNLRHSLRAKLGKLLQGSNLAKSTNSPPNQESIGKLSPKSAGSQYSEKVHNPQSITIGQSQPITIDGTNRVSKSQNSNSAVVQSFGLKAVNTTPSTSAKRTVLSLYGLVSKNTVSIQPYIGQSQLTSVEGTDMAKRLSRGKPVIIQNSKGKLILGKSPRASAGNLVQVVSNHAGKIINVQPVIQPSIGQTTFSRSPCSSDVQQHMPACPDQNLKACFKQVLLSHPKSSIANSLCVTPEGNTDLVTILIPQIPPNTNHSSSTDSSPKSPVKALPLILSKKSMRHLPLPCNDENSFLVHYSNQESKLQDLPDNVINVDATDLVDNGGGDVLQTSPPSCPSDTLTHNSLENVEVESAGCGTASQTNTFREVIVETDTRKSSARDSLYIPSLGDHRYSKAVTTLKLSASKGISQGVEGTKRCSPYALPRKIEKRCFVCGKMIHNRTLLFSHEKSHFKTLGSSSYDCRLCTESFETFDEMVSHRRKHKRGEFTQRRKHQNVEQVECREEVSKTMPSEDTSFADDDFGMSEIAGDGENLSEVPKEKSKNCKTSSKPTPPSKKCTMCDLSFKKKVELDEHILSHSEEERATPFPCRTCEKRFTSRKSLNSHSQSHNAVSELCPHCGKIFKLRASLTSHIRLKHGASKHLPSHQCQFCPKKFRFPKQLLIHSTSHTGERPYVCDKCGKSFRTPSTFRQHQACHNEARPVKCKVCGRGFKWTKNLIQHSMTHISKHLRPINHVTNKYKKKPVQCNLCGKTLTTSTALKVHKYKFHRDIFFRENPGVENLICKVCPRIFSSQTGFEDHMHRWHSESPESYSCDFCLMRFDRKVRRDIHLRVHTGERPYACQHCDKTFSCSAYLKAHLICHSEIRRHSCQYCDKQFKKKSHLNVHVRSHTGERPYECDVCGRRFIQVSEKNKHRGTHFDGKPFECTICESFFRKKKELLEHMNEQHRPEDVFEEEVEIDYSAILPSDYEDVQS